MTYDATAQKLAVKVIGTVESNLNYSAVNYNDPITVGIAQWYGTRAAGILNRMRTANAGEWYGVQASLNNQLTTIASSDTFWNGRYLTQSEGESLIGVMSRNQALQNTQLTEDLDAYVPVFESYGFDADAHTDTLIYFMSMHHQGPLYALEIIETLDTECTLEQMHNACLTHVSESAGVVVLGKYGSRYNTTYNLIVEADLSGVDPEPPATPTPTQPNGNAKLIQVQGDLLLVQFGDGERVTWYPSGRGQWMPRKTADAPPPPTPVQPPPPVDVGTWHHPLTGTPVITSPYGPRSFDGFHYGVDLANSGAAGNVVAPTALILTIAYNAGTGGNATAGGYVKGHTTDGAYTFNFYHLAPGTVGVNAGQTVAAGAVLGVEGATGNVTGRHLHFEAYNGTHNDPWPPPYGTTIDPLPVLRAHGVNI